ncbi:DNA polymerase III subunit delta [Rhodospirillaceae bacterium SYSU D60014]|uniref:DNA polymerase III subunit delta n=1 Tax=Virgifigura deserti TaxID=2268457 RepID=UPI000E673132
MKLSGRQIEPFLKQPDPAVGAVLFYGPDAGLVRERADRLAQAVAGDATDPFQISEMTAAALRDDPARLADEAAALAFGGGRRVVRLRSAGDSIASLFRSFLGGPPAPALLLVEAGELGPRSALREVFEKARNAAALPCYRDEGVELSQLIEGDLRRQGFGITPEALSYLLANLGNDRAITRAELEKLRLYMGDATGVNPGAARVELADAIACIGANAALFLDDLAFAVADGDLSEIERIFPVCLAESGSGVTILRAVARHFLRIHSVRATMAAGTPRERAVKTLRPPVFFKVLDRFHRQLDRWAEPALAIALDRLIAAERACKRTGAPAEALCHRALMQVAQQAARSARRVS